MDTPSTNIHCCHYKQMTIELQLKFSESRQTSDVTAVEGVCAKQAVGFTTQTYGFVTNRIISFDLEVGLFVDIAGKVSYL